MSLIWIKYRIVLPTVISLNSLMNCPVKYLNIFHIFIKSFRKHSGFGGMILRFIFIINYYYLKFGQFCYDVSRCSLLSSIWVFLEILESVFWQHLLLSQILDSIYLNTVVFLHLSSDTSVKYKLYDFIIFHITFPHSFLYLSFFSFLYALAQVFSLTYFAIH